MYKFVPEATSIKSRMNYFHSGNDFYKIGRLLLKMNI